MGYTEYLLYNALSMKYFLEGNMQECLAADDKACKAKGEYLRESLEEATKAYEEYKEKVKKNLES